MRSTKRPLSISARDRCTYAARLRSNADLAVQTLREDASDSGLADAARSSKEKRVVNAPGFEGIDQSAADMLLPDQLGKFLWGAIYAPARYSS